MEQVSVKNLSKFFKAPNGKERLEILRNLSFSVERGECVCVVGPSGCGKSTLLEMLAGFQLPDAGSVYIVNELVQNPSSNRTIVFQDYVLFPWMTVRRNIAFGLKCRGASRTEQRQTVDALLVKFGLTGFADHYPKQISGGMQQRVAIARAFAVKPDVILMDEPFSALDEQTRFRMQIQLKEFQRQSKMTVIFVTHSVEEALYLGNRVIVLSARPAEILRVIDVPVLAGDRQDVLNTANFRELEREVRDLLEPSDIGVAA